MPIYMSHDNISVIEKLIVFLVFFYFKCCSVSISDDIRRHILMYFTLKTCAMTLGLYFFLSPILRTCVTMPLHHD